MLISNRSVLPLGKKVLSVGQRLRILEILILEGPCTVGGIASSSAIIGNVLTSKQLSVRMAAWVRAYETENEPCPIKLVGHEYSLWDHPV